MISPVFGELSSIVKKFLKLRFKATFKKEEVWVRVTLTSEYTGLDRPYGFVDIQYFKTLEDCASEENQIQILENKQKKMDAKVHNYVKEFLSGLETFDAVEKFVLQRVLLKITPHAYATLIKDEKDADNI